MNRSRWILAAWIVGLALCFPAMPAWSNITSSTGSAAPSVLNTGTAQTVSLQWSLSSTITTPPSSPSTSVNSTNIVIKTPGGQVLSTISTSLQTTVAAQRVVPYNIVYSLSETVNISQSVLSQAQSLGAAQLRLERTFSESPGTSTATVTVTLTLTSTPSASITSASGTAAPSVLYVGSPQTVSVQWTVSGTVSNTATSSIRSTGATLKTPAGQSLMTVTTPVQDSLSITQTSQSVTYRMNETLSISQGVLFQALKKSAGQLLYTRTFTQTPGSNQVDATAVLNLSGSSGGALQISRIELRFADDTIEKVTHKDARLNALANLNFNGAGLLDAVWEIAYPSSTRGDAVYSPLLTLRQYLSASDHVVLQSPQLPTGSTGLYLLRLRIVEPSLSFTLPVLRYRVQQEGTDVLETPADLPIQAPDPQAALADDTRFVWQPVTGAKVYQLELYDAPIDGGGAEKARRRPVTGVLVTGRRESVMLSIVSRGYLQPGRTYHWRVLAVGPEGRVLAISTPRAIRVP